MCYLLQKGKRGFHYAVVRADMWEEVRICRYDLFCREARRRQESLDAEAEKGREETAEEHTTPDGLGEGSQEHELEPDGGREEGKRDEAPPAESQEETVLPPAGRELGEAEEEKEEDPQVEEHGDGPKPHTELEPMDLERDPFRQLYLEKVSVAEIREAMEWDTHHDRADGTMAANVEAMPGIKERVPASLSEGEDETGRLPTPDAANEESRLQKLDERDGSSLPEQHDGTKETLGHPEPTGDKQSESQIFLHYSYSLH